MTDSNCFRSEQERVVEENSFPSTLPRDQVLGLLRLGLEADDASDETSDIEEWPSIS